ncbi:MAG: hypothetical protein HY828_11825 [Actinobacteria bacterium]|nr:hypothetical protein [Actinomycetota bacterium]
MKTRTLLLLAVTCGLAILVAGTVQLLRLANQDKATVLAIGESATAGDARVEVTAYDEADGIAVVTVSLSGVDDPDGLQGFTLVGAGAVSEPSGTGDDACTGFTVEPVSCTLSFATTAMKTADRLLVFTRADQTVRWKLA